MPSLELQQKLVGLQMVKILTLFSYSTIVTDEETETNDITNRVWKFCVLFGSCYDM